MISEQEYNDLIQYKPGFEEFERTGKYKGGALSLLNTMMQRKGLGDICFSCEGSKANAVREALGWIREYEENNKK